MRKPTVAIAAYMMAVFASGVLVGGFGHRLYTASTVIAAPERNSAEFRQRYLEEMRSRLTLDGQQVGKLNTILDETRDRYREVRERTRPEMKQIHDEQVQKIRSILSEPQQVEYEKFRQEREKRKEMERKQSGL